MGKWYGLFKLISEHVAGKMANQVRADVEAIQKANQQFKWTHADKIKELADDSGLSKDYLKDLIRTSKNKTDLEALMDYLKANGKVNNLSTYDVGALKRMINGKLEKIYESELLKQMIEGLKQKGTSHLDDLSEFVKELI